MLFAVAFLINFQSCKTSPKPIVVKIEENKTISWDNNEQNAGIVKYVKGKGFLITESAANKYKYLTKTFGGVLTPSLKEGEGLVFENDLIYLPNQYMVSFMVLNDLIKNIK